ncbi:MAG TPA: thiamine phosphate synthase [Candidatus Bacteroides avicola]|uniref:Thiamine-phosphate synthase n=1 Tax=Candidatus Bacteroides avicola TaxID=2838468 RepID=A0A9D2HVW2_9BACE|nr:thiamine phosphate synthase [Mediterranea sp. An20]MBW9203393.1 thiamine phosphate synthase [Bacteroidales bacterium SW292]OUP09121.1 thiamine-phosphate diphosphorylase [Mediterranea sp. An20]HJA84742.1 thiamine phosphate synthase [Candidatus Bacteroides avicola]
MIPIQFITHYTERYSYLDSARIALEGGCRWIQLRMKNCPLSEVEAVGRQVKALCKEHDAIFIIDDYVELAQKLEADGVHLGKNDMPVAEARQVLGEGFLIGGTANTFEDIVRHYQGGADYIGCGPFRFTTTKQNLSPVLGLQGYASLMQQMKEADIHLPVVAIGGITRQDIPDILRTGVHGIALSGAVLHADNPVKEMQDILNL